MHSGLRSLLKAGPPWIVGVLNITPDSFSDGGKYLECNVAVQKAQTLRSEGADIVEIGGESTAPGSFPISAEEEWRRIEKPLTQIALDSAGDIVISVDTYKRKVAERALQAGAKIINDVSALRADPDLAEVVADHKAALMIMHSKDFPLPHVTEKPKEYQDVISEIAQFLLRQAELAITRGVSQDLIVLDPGMSKFVSHDTKYSWQLLRAMDRFVELVKPFPVMIGVSRKGFLGGKMEDRDAISQHVASLMVKKGVRFVRTHSASMMKGMLGVDKKILAG